MIARSDYRNWKDAKRATAVHPHPFPRAGAHAAARDARSRWRPGVRYIYKQPDLSFAF